MNRRTIALVGIGHTHAHIVRQWIDSPPEGCRLVCISPYAIATYSGMLPGVLSRQYTQQQMQIELAPLCQRADAQLHISPAVAVDSQNQQIELANGDLVAYDLLSIGIGSIPQTTGVAFAPDSTVMVKPMQTLLPRLDEQMRPLIEVCRRQSRPLRVAIVGGGAAGVEIAFCFSRRLELDYPEVPRELRLVESHRTVLTAETGKMQRLATRLLQQRKVKLQLNSRVRAVGTDSIELDSGHQFPVDLVIWAAGASPPRLLQDMDLPRNDSGFLLTCGTLQSRGSDRVFVVGDTGTIVGESYAKAGVYAVRQGPVLWKNLQAMLSGETLDEFHPQGKFLRLLNTADGKAMLDYHGLVMHGRWCWWLKDWIDRRFVGKYQVESPASEQT